MADLKQRAPHWPTVLVAAIGLALSIVLEVLHYRAYTMPSASSFCTVASNLDCESVALSRFSMFLGVPMPIWGVAGFLAMLIAAWQRSRWLLPLAAVASVASLGLLLISLVAIKSVCLFCEGVHLASWVLLVMAWRQRATEQVPFRDVETGLLTLAPAAGLVIAAMVFQRPYWGAFGWKGDVPFKSGKTEQGHPWIGAENPKLVVHEFTDYSCPHCKAASIQTLRDLASHPNELRIVRRQYPRMACPVGSKEACKFARIAYCSEEQGKFWQADRWLFEHGTGRQEVELDVAASDLGLDEARLRSCVERADIYKRADDESREARKRRIMGTPYYIVGDKGITLEELSAMIGGL